MSEEQVPKQEELTEEQLAYMAFLKENRERCAMWIKSHGNMDFPVIATMQNGGTVYVWLNRKDRRRVRNKK